MTALLSSSDFGISFVFMSATKSGNNFFTRTYRLFVIEKSWLAYSVIFKKIITEQR